MSVNTPYDRLAGTFTVYVGPAGEAAPAVNAAPAGNWDVLGPTNDAQEIRHGGRMTYFRDNDHQAPVKAVLSEESPAVMFTVVGLTQENYAAILHDAANITTAAGPPATKTIPVKRGFDPTEYAILLRGESDSPYGNFPGQWYFPRGVFDGEPVQARARNGSPGLRVEFILLEDDTEAAGEELGVWEVQTA